MNYHNGLVSHYWSCYFSRYPSKSSMRVPTLTEELRKPRLESRGVFKVRARCQSQLSTLEFGAGVSNLVPLSEVPNSRLRTHGLALSESDCESGLSLTARAGGVVLLLPRASLFEGSMTSTATHLSTCQLNHRVRPCTLELQAVLRCCFMTHAHAAPSTLRNSRARRQTLTPHPASLSFPASRPGKMPPILLCKLGRAHR
jgi:hypothetical protein